MTCLHLWFVPDTPLKQARRNASLDKNTNVEYSSVSLCETEKKNLRYNSSRQIYLEGALAVRYSLHLPDIHDTNQLFGYKPQRERVQQKSENTEHHLE